MVNSFLKLTKNLAQWVCIVSSSSCSSSSGSGSGSGNGGGSGSGSGSSSGSGSGSSNQSHTNRVHPPRARKTRENGFPTYHKE